jgi:hypothetical protein
LEDIPWSLVICLKYGLEVCDFANGYGTIKTKKRKKQEAKVRNLKQMAFDLLQAFKSNIKRENSLMLINQ